MTLDYVSEEILLNQWQPLQTILYDGWILRFADGYTKRANSVNPLYFSTKSIHDKIAYCEEMYTAHRLQTMFKITPFIQPKDLDEILAAKGYDIVEPASVQRLNLSGQLKEPSMKSVRIEEQVSDEWIDYYCSLSLVDPKHKPTMKQMLSNRCMKRGFFTLYHDGEVVACGLGMVERKVLGLFDIVTSCKYRNQGFGEQLILNILRWGKEKGAEHSDLAVVLSNEPALRLYAKFGYKEIYRYWYRAI